MKIVAITLLAFVAAICANPVSISDNNVGDIVTVGVNANLSLKNEINQNIINIIVALLNQQGIVIPINGGASPVEAAALPEMKISPEIIANVKSILTNN